MHKFNINNMNKLDNPKRREVLPPDKILHRLNINEGDVFADIGCGIGYFSIPAAKLVGEDGVVYALDISPEMLKILEEKIQLERLVNIKIIKSQEYNLILPDNTATVVFTCNVVHEVGDRHRFLCELKRILAEDGRIVIIDWEKVQSDYGPPIDHRIDRAEIQKVLVDLAFKEISTDALNEYFYVITAKK